MYRIFINYRRCDSLQFSRSLFERLRPIFGRRVFLDTSGIHGGDKWAQMIEQTISGSDVFVAVISKAWLECTDERGTHRLSDPDDWVRREIVLALKSRRTLVIPVLVDGANKPENSELPSDLLELFSNNFIAINTSKFDSDVEPLIAAIEARVPRRKRWPLYGAAAAVAAAMIGGFLYFKPPAPEFQGIAFIPDRDLYGTLSEVEGRPRHHALSIKVGALTLEMPDLTRQAIYIGRDAAALEAGSPAHDEVEHAIKSYLTTEKIDDVDTITGKLLSHSAGRTAPGLGAGATVVVELVRVDTTTTPPARQPVAHCTFEIPDPAPVTTPVYFLPNESNVCSPAP